MPADILLDVWREVGRHIEIAEAVERLTPLLARRLPIDVVLVRRIDLDHRRLETVAVGRSKPSAPPEAARTDLDANQMERLVAWSARREILGGASRGDDPLLRLLVSPAIDGSVFAVPLVGETGPLGVLVLAARPPRVLRAEDASIASKLLEPFTVALENDSRVHELTRLRETVEAENRALLTRLERQDITDAIVGSEAGLRDVMRRVEQVARTDTPVLILGETGSGKEVIARAIHAQSRRASGPMVRVNCGAIPPELVDSELFGHERGSFTGAVAARKGWFERADGGTLFLDEIGELPRPAQVRLLRVLQDGTFERVGAQRSLSVDVRLVTATHRDLHAMVDQRGFREDLWYRIGVFPIRLPPLRERLEDLPALAAHFAWRAGKRIRGAPLTPTSRDLEFLLGYAWPGNVRELAAVIERAAILGDGRTLDVATALGVAESAPRPGVPPPAGDAPADDASDSIAASAVGVAEGLDLDGATARHIERALAVSRGRIEGPHGAAVLLRVNPHTLRARMRKLRIDWAKYRSRESAR